MIVVIIIFIIVLDCILINYIVGRAAGKKWWPTLGHVCVCACHSVSIKSLRVNTYVWICDPLDIRCVYAFVNEYMMGSHCVEFISSNTMNDIFGITLLLFLI